MARMLLLLQLLVLLTVSLPIRAQDAPPAVKETVIEAKVDGAYTVTPGGGALLRMATTREGDMLVVNGTKGAVYDRILGVHAVCGNEPCYLARAHGKTLMVRGTLESDPYDALKLLMVSASRSAAAVRPENYLWSDPGVPQIRLGSADATAFEDNAVLAMEGVRLVCVAVKAKKQVVVVDGRAERLYDRIGALLLSPDGAHLAYSAKRGATWRVVCDGVEQRPYTAIGSTYQEPFCSSLFFTANSKHLAYFGYHEQQLRVVVDGREYVEDDPAVASYRTALRRVGYASATMMVPAPMEMVVAKQGNKWVTVSSKPRYPTMEQPLCTPDGNLLAFVITRKRQQLVVEGEKEGKSYDRILDMESLPGGKSVFFLAQHGLHQLFVIRGVEQSAYDKIIGQYGEYLHCSPDGKHFAYVAKLGDHFRVVRDGKPSLPYDAEPVDLTFSPDNRHLAYRVADGDHQQLIIDEHASPSFAAQFGPITYNTLGDSFFLVKTDGKYAIATRTTIGALYDEIYTNPDNRAVFFDTPTIYHYYARRGDLVYRVDIRSSTPTAIANPRPK